MWISQKHKNLDTLRTKNCFSFKYKNSLVTHQGLFYGKNSFVTEVTLKEIKKTHDGSKEKKVLCSKKIYTYIFCFEYIGNICFYLFLILLWRTQPPLPRTIFFLTKKKTTTTKANIPLVFASKIHNPTQFSFHSTFRSYRQWIPPPFLRIQPDILKFPPVHYLRNTFSKHTFGTSQAVCC